MASQLTAIAVKIILCLVFFSASALVGFGVFLFIIEPYKPEFSLVLSSTTVQNISEYDNRYVRMDLNVSFMFHNPNFKGMIYQDIRALAFQYEAPVGRSTNSSFQQLPKSRSIEWFGLQNTTSVINAWDDVDNGSRSGNNSMNGKSEASLGLRFELRGYVSYKGKMYFSEQKIPIQVVCDQVDILLLLSSNNSTSTTPSVAPFGQPTGSCDDDLEWRTSTDHCTFCDVATNIVSVLIAVPLIVSLAVFCLSVYFCIVQ